MRLTCILFICCGYISLFAQQKFSKEFSFNNDNDLYISTVKDRYYSNGMILSYRYLASDFGKLEKKIYQFRLGHEIYTPFKPIVSNIIEHDRPFASYLYGSFGIQRVYKDQSSLSTSIQLGVLGPGAGGEGLQNFIHSLYNFQRVEGWKYQIQNTLGLNLDVDYIKSLTKQELEHTDFNILASARLGTIYNEISTGFMGRIGFLKLQDFSNSLAFKTHLNNDNTKYNRGIESFLYYKAMATYVIYDATIEGGLFNDDSVVTYNPKPFRLNLELGFRFTSNRWNFGYAYHFHSNKLDNLRKNRGNDYGRLFFGYLFN